MSSTIIQAKNISKTYRIGRASIPVLHDVSCEIKQGEMIAIMGPSGSGKSTVMNMIGLLDRPSDGAMTIDDQHITLDMSDATLAKIRSQKIGFVFQSFNLLPKMSALANVLVPTTYTRAIRGEARKNAEHMMSKLGLSHRLHHKPSELSGGEKQRVAIARALINDPEIILADEPTGNLDSKSGKEVIGILKDLHKQGKTVIIITHDASIAAECGRTLHMLDGTIVDTKTKEKS